MQPSSIDPHRKPGESGAAVRLVPLAPEHAAAAARLHLAGQPGTFLTDLGPNVLTVLYSAMAHSAVGFGFAAPPVPSPAVSPTMAPQTTLPPICGFVSATTSVGGLFVEMGTRRLPTLLPALLTRYVQRPSLALRSVQTLLYPFLAGESDGDTDGASAELLSIMVEPDQRGRGVGGRLLAALVTACGARGIDRLDVTVDAANEGARRFYARHGFVFHHDFVLYGRAMCSYRLGVLKGREGEK